MLALMKAGGTYARDLKHLGDVANLARIEQEVDRSTTASLSPEPELPPDILSASSYHEMMTMGIAAPILQCPPVMYGGFRSNDIERPSKRQRGENRIAEEDFVREASEPAQNVNKKSRGRPRVEPSDETPQQRRRTQIRLAQRNYRQRKETTITELKGRVTELQSLLDNMNRSFVQLHDDLYTSGVLNAVGPNDRVAHQLQQLTDLFSEVNAQIPEEEGYLPDDTAWTQQPLDQSRSCTPPENIHLHHSRTGSEVAGHSSRTTSTTGHEVSVSSSKRRGVTLSEIAEVESRLLALIEPFQRLPLEKPINSAPIFTYSFQETSFARRLHRQTLERAFQFLANPAANPAILSRTFRFSFTFSNRERMLESIQDILTRQAGESLENWKIPFLGLGGAGSHFPPRDKNGLPITPPNKVDLAVVLGPIELPNAHSPRAERRVEDILEAIGLGGEWFDTHDVEEYLKSRGLFLNAHSTFATFVPDASFTYRQDALAHAPQTGHTRMASMPRSVPNRGKSNLATNYANMGTAVACNQNYNSFPTYLTLDVERFLTSLIDRSVCLGRAPGFRKSNVEKSLHLSIQTF